jgi:hypothetical protein
MLLLPYRLLCRRATAVLSDVGAAVPARHPFEEHAMSISNHIRAAALAAIVFVVPFTAKAQAVLKVNDSISVRFGLLSQTWVDYTQNVRQDTSYAQNIFQRRMRFIFSGQVGSKLSFFFQTDNPNLGRSGPGFIKAPGTGFILQDGYIEVKPSASNVFMLDAGLQLIPLCRNCIASASSLLPIDYSSYSFLQSGVTASSAGRDVGFMAKGVFADQKVEYRVGVFSGARLPISPTPLPVGFAQTASNSVRAAGRLMVNFLDIEPPSYVLPGTYLGRKKVFNVGGGFDAQSRYKAYAGDAFLSYPFGVNGVTLSGTFIRYNGDTFFPTLPKQNTFEVEGGYHFTDAKITPWAKFEARRYDDAVKSLAFQNDRRFQIGGTYYVAGNYLNVKLAYTRATFDQLAPLPTLEQNGVTMQLQGFYY